MQGERIGQIEDERGNIARVQMWTMLIRFMEEIADPNGTFEGEGCI
jgi:hypothetical protein